MHECDLAVISFGVTAYELASLKVPAIYLCLTPDHSKSATAFVDAGFGVNLGVYDSVNDETIISLIDIYMLNESKIANMVNALAKVKTMNGASTIARTIIENNII